MYLKSLKLENIKAFEKLELDFSRPGENVFAGINVFVGGNASGKSTLLKCIAMALSGANIANQLIISPNGWIRNDSVKGTIEANYISFNMALLDSTASGRRDFSRSESELLFSLSSSGNTVLRQSRYDTQNNTTPVQLSRLDEALVSSLQYVFFLAAYGPLRRLSGSSTEALRNSLSGGRLASCATLFREDAALSESETWLKQEHARSLEQKSQGNDGTSLVEDVKEFLNDGLLPDGFQIANISVDYVTMQTPNGGELPIGDLSDGYRSSFALILDIIRNMADTFRHTTIFGRDDQNRLIVDKPGIVLIDELEAHLHPSWQRLICEWLKTRFPNIQFFITTHSPLIAQAADEGGLYVLPLPNEISSGQTVRRLSPHEQERVTLGRAEKVLLGEAFGLKQTWGRRAETLVKKWEWQTSKRMANAPLSPMEESDYKELERQVEIIFDEDPAEVLNA